MVGTVTDDMALIDACDSVTGWTAGGGIMTINTEDMIEGLGCIGLKVAASTAQFAYRTITEITTMSGKLLYVWIMGLKGTQFETKANGGIAVRLGTNNTNYRTWYVGGSNAYRGGWECFAVDPTQGGSIADVGTYNVNSITYVAVGFKGSATAVAKTNSYFDYIHYGTGLTIYGGTSGSPATIADIMTYEDTNKRGVVYKYEGVYFVQGKLKYGSTSVSSDTYFKDTSKTLSFIDRIVASNYYEIVLQGKSAQTTEVYFGTKSGTKGISGCTFMAMGTAKFKVTTTDANLTKYGFYGCTFLNADVITFPTYDVNKEVINCNFEACAMVIASTASISYSKFLNSPAHAVQISSTSFHITYTDFISCATAIEFTAAGPYSFNSLSFSSNTYDAHNTYGSTIAVSYDSGCSPAPSSYDPAGSVVTFATSVTLTVRHVKSGNEPTTYAVVAIYKASDMTQIMDTDASTADDQNAGYYKASTSYTTTGIAVKVRARYKGYLPFEVTLTIPANGLDVTAIWIADPNYTP